MSPFAAQLSLSGLVAAALVVLAGAGLAGEAPAAPSEPRENGSQSSSADTSARSPADTVPGNSRRPIIRGGKITILGPDGQRQEFSLPAAEADWDGVLPQSNRPMSGDPVRKPMIGVSLVAVPEELAAHLGLEAGQGAMIGMVRDDSPARRAGLVRFDIITHVNAQPVYDLTALQRTIETSQESALRLSLIHAGQKQEIELSPEMMTVPPLDWGTRSPGSADQVTERMLHELRRHGLDTEGMTVLGSGFHLPHALQPVPDPALEPLREELRQLRQELRELRELLQKRELPQE